MSSLKLEFLLFFTFLFANCAHSQSINDGRYDINMRYDNYSQLFRNKVGSKKTIQMTQFSTGLERCGRFRRAACKYYIYLYQPQNSSNIRNTILFNGGIHGDQKIGSFGLLHLYELAQPPQTRIIYFPVMNPSGFDLQTRQTSNQIDLNRDYPIDGNKNCYQGSATRIIDQIFRRYKIDLTINLHQGTNSITWNWGTVAQSHHPLTPDQPIYSSIAKMVNNQSGTNQAINMQQFEIGTMTEKVYPARGTLDDWAYAASWSETTPSSCNNYTFKPYPKDMCRSLVFLMELGGDSRINYMPSVDQYGSSEGLYLPKDSNELSNGYVTRTIRALLAMIKVVNPIVNANIQNSILRFQIDGCKSIGNISLFFVDQVKQLKYKLYRQAEDTNSDVQTFQTEILVDLTNVAIDNKNQYNLFYSFQCNRQWYKIGKSFLSKQRIFSNTVKIKPNNLAKKIVEQNLIKISNKKQKVLAMLLSLSVQFSILNSSPTKQCWHLFLSPSSLLGFELPAALSALSPSFLNISIPYPLSPFPCYSSFKAPNQSQIQTLRTSPQLAPYAAPQMFLIKQAKQADVWAVGAIIYKMVYGKNVLQPASSSSNGSSSQKYFAAADKFINNITKIQFSSKQGFEDIIQILKKMLTLSSRPQWKQIINAITQIVQSSFKQNYYQLLQLLESSSSYMKSLISELQQLQIEQRLPDSLSFQSLALSSQSFLAKVKAVLLPILPQNLRSPVQSQIRIKINNVQSNLKSICHQKCQQKSVYAQSCIFSKYILLKEIAKFKQKIMGERDFKFKNMRNMNILYRIETLANMVEEFINKFSLS